MKLTRTIAAAAALTIAFAAPASAHEGPIGDGGPFRIEMSTPDPEGIESKWGNGEVEFHVEPGVEVVVFGVENEPMIKVAADGAMLANENSPTWWLNQPDTSVPGNASATAEPNWVWKMSGGSMQFHDHRFHFMQGVIDPATQDGASLFEFALPISVNGEMFEYKGSLIFDSTIDPAAAERLKAGMVENDTTMDDMGSPAPVGTSATTEPGSGSSSTAVFVIAGAALIVAIAGGVVLMRRR